ncbi:MAG: CapA family protein [Spirochaetaceae bacterium]|nr:CapA family protein [Spirochaetaceae bacterium]
MRSKKFTPGLFAVLLFCSCAGKTQIWVDYNSFPEPEKSFLASVLTGKELEKRGLVPCGGPGPGVITIAYQGAWVTWEGSDTDSLYSFIPGEGGFLPLSRTCLVPRALLWEETAGIGAAEAARIFSGNRESPDIIPLGDLGPPYVGRRVDGLDAADPAYPLVLLEGLQFDREGSLGENKNESKKLWKKTAGLSELIMARLRAANSRTPEASGVPVPRYEERPRLYRIAAGGDAMLARGVPEILLKEGPEAVMGGTAALAGAADLSLLNLEGAVTLRGEPAKKAYAFRFDPAVIRVLADSGFDAVLAANNHAFDYGLTGFLDTLDHLKRAGLYALGAGRSISAAAAPFITGSEQFPVRVFGLASFGRERSGWDGLDYAADDARPGMLHAGKRGAELIRAQLELLNDKEGLEIVFFHGGIEYADYPDEDTRVLYTDLVEAGADLVIGTHPHVEQGFEWVKGRPVFWSLGDYVFDDMADTPGGDRGIFIVLSFLETKLVYLDVYPVFMNGPRTVISSDTQLERFYRLTKELNPVQL